MWVSSTGCFLRFSTARGGLYDLSEVLEPSQPQECRKRAREPGTGADPVKPCWRSVVFKSTIQYTITSIIDRSICFGLLLVCFGPNLGEDRVEIPWFFAGRIEQSLTLLEHSPFKLHLTRRELVQTGPTPVPLAWHRSCGSKREPSSD